MQGFYTLDHVYFRHSILSMAGGTTGEVHSADSAAMTTMEFGVNMTCQRYLLYNWYRGRLVLIQV